VASFTALTIAIGLHGPEFGWVYKYSERKAVKSGSPWRIRHTGIYHLLDREQARTVLFVISPSPTAQFVTYLRENLLKAEVRSTILENPVLTHSMLISMHLPSWQNYLEYQETLLLRLVSNLCVLDHIEKIAIDSKLGYEVGVFFIRAATRHL
jgi:hypothetical protein